MNTNTQNATFQTVLDALLDPKKEFPRRYLQQFSDIGTLELKTLLDTWPRIGLSRKLSLLENLESLADEDTLVSFEDLARPLLDDPEAGVRIRALHLLNECDDVKLIPGYLTMLKADADAEVRAEAANALGPFMALGELEEIAEEAYSQVQAGLLESARSVDETRVRRLALESLGYASTEEVIALIEAALQQRDAGWRASALTAIGRSADDRWEDEVLQALLNENTQIRRAAVQAAGSLMLKSARMVLLRILEEDEDDEVTSAVIWSLSQIGGEDVRTYLENLIDQTEDEAMLEFLEEALDNLAFTDDLERFDLMAFSPDELGELDDLDDVEAEDE